MQRLVLPKKTWKLSGTRPLNHPQRRLAALALIACHWPKLRRSTEARDFAGLEKLFAALDHPFWKFHYTLTAEPAGRPMAILGESRVTDILANVFFPFWFAEDESISADYQKLPSRLTNRKIETAATRLFGDDSRRFELLKSVAHQQGLLQIYEDFCLQDHSDCDECPFPEQMAKWV
jgi:hypothetical protein